MGGWLLALETGFVAAAAFWVAAALFSERGALVRGIATLLWAPTFILWSIQLCGDVGRLTPLPTALVSTFLCGAAVLWAARRLPFRRAFALLKQDARAPLRAAEDAWRTREPAFWVVPIAAAAFLLSVALVWFFRSWAWDAVWYHVPITAFTIQEHSTGWIETHIPWISSYPRNVEWLAAWACLFTRDSRLDDASQLPFGLLAAAAIAAWSRRMGASPSLSAGSGAAFLLLPPVFLQLHTTHVDVACAAFLVSAVFFTAEPISARSRTMGFLAMGLYAGTKLSGLFHLAFWLPWASVRAWREWRESAHRLRTAVSFVGSAVLFASVSAHTYVLNFLHRGNPAYPFEVRLPGIGKIFDGPWKQSRLFEVPEGGRLYFFGTPDAFKRTVLGWFETHVDHWPDIRSGGFGPLFRWVLLPALLLLAIQMSRRQVSLRRGLPILALVAMALSVPAAWWPRFVLGTPAAGLVAFAVVVTALPRGAVRAAVSLAFVVVACVGFGTTLARMKGPFPSLLPAAVRASPEARDTMQLETWQWPVAGALRREQDLQPGDVVAYDESTSFLGELFSRGYRTRVVYVPSAGDPEDYLHRVRAAGARWVGVRAGSVPERLLQRGGAQYLFAAPRSEVVLYRLPAETTAAKPLE